MLGQHLEPQADPLAAAVDVDDQLLGGVPQQRRGVERRLSHQWLRVERDASSVREHHRAEAEVPVQQEPLTLGRSQGCEEIHRSTHELTVERPTDPDVS